MLTRKRTHTALTLLRWYYLRHPGRALYYIRVQTTLYGWRWVVGQRIWTGKLYARS